MKKICLFDPSYVTIKGLPFVKEGHLSRFPLHLSKTIWHENPALESLSYHLSGGVLFFETDANRLEFDVLYEMEPVMNHMSALGESGFDLYILHEGRFVFYDSIRPFPRQKMLKTTVILHPSGLKKIMMYTPLYTKVTHAYVHLEDVYSIKPYEPGYHKRIFWYGTSITQGACASRPGMSYTNQLSRELNVEVINMGFSGNGLGELGVARVTHELSQLDAVIIDYEANAGAVFKLKETLVPWIQCIREKHKNVPIMVISRIPFTRELWQPEDHQKRMDHKDYQQRIVTECQDLHPLYFIDGEELIYLDEHEVTVDGIHLNDLGMTLFAKRLLPKLKHILFNDKIEI